MKKFLTAFIFCALSLWAGAETVFFHDSGTFTVPENIYRIYVRVVGGNGGHGASCYSRRWGFPGGPGGFRQSVIAVSPGESIDVLIGYGGAGACGGGGGGGGGGVKVIGSHFTIWAGGGGGGRGTGGGCPFCGDDGGNSYAIFSW